MATEVDPRIIRRKLFIRLGQKHHRPGLGSSRAFLAQRTADMDWPRLREVLRPVPYAIVGGVATRMYMPERLTKDLDIIVAASQSGLVTQKLQEASFRIVTRLAMIPGSTWVAPNGQEIDVLEGTEQWWPMAIAQSQDNLDVHGEPVLTLPYLVLMKYAAGRAQDLADIERMLGHADDVTVAAVRDVFLRHAPSEIDDLDAMIALARLDRDA
jgi:hypothetical protein